MRIFIFFEQAPRLGHPTCLPGKPSFCLSPWQPPLVLWHFCGTSYQDLGNQALPWQCSTCGEQFTQTDEDILLFARGWTRTST